MASGHAAPTVPEPTSGAVTRYDLNPGFAYEWRSTREDHPQYAGHRLRPHEIGRSDIGYVDCDWSAEEWTRGCYGAHFPPGVWTQFGPSLREPVGGHWSSSSSDNLRALAIGVVVWKPMPPQ